MLSSLSSLSLLSSLLLLLLLWLLLLLLWLLLLLFFGGQRRRRRLPVPVAVALVLAIVDGALPKGPDLPIAYS